MLRAGRLLPVPAQLQGRDITVHYTSPLFQSQKASEAEAILQALTSSAQLLQADPGLLQNLDLDATFRAIWVARNANPRLLRRIQEVARIRQSQEQMQNLAQQAQVAESVAAAAKDAATGIREMTGIGAT